MVRGERELLAKEREANAAERERARAELEAARQRLDETREGRIHQVEEELTRVRAVLEAARQRLDETREARIHELREELNRVREELDNKRQLRLTEADEAHSAAAESHEWLHNQLTEIANLVQQNHACCEENKAASEERWAEKQHRKIERDGQIQELLGIVARIVEEQNAAKREEDARQANEGKPGMEQVLEDLARQNAEQRELFYALSEAWRTDNQRQHEELINAVRATANEQVPYNIQEHLDAFSEALAIDVRTLLGEIGKLREERRAIQHEVGLLMTMRAKYCSGGEFGGNWSVTQAPHDGPPPDAPPQPQDAPRRTADLRTARRIRKQNPVQPPEAESEVPPSKHIQSWATWLPNPAMAPTPPSVEPTLVVPDHQSPGLFGPRSPRDSFRCECQPCLLTDCDRYLR
ncbi:hypothetical protein EDD16DRAFT_1488479 [Pisolithus croceorrhizus]|nr:hypothetical protein EDD16DRAFT_1488479 [Pisolithus croceorrhizus]KAI6124112.1 hypothetical protein EV401DRAFT_1857024 [Pisolithus croceorrhizus]KAI6160684.1 hypothetical protein EDD17DRAFT_1482978 [Pisolithus thermaeus]